MNDCDRIMRNMEKSWECNIEKFFMDTRIKLIGFRRFDKLINWRDPNDDYFETIYLN